MSDELMLIEGSNFRGFPPGGQSTKIIQYLHCLSPNVKLVGISSVEAEVGRWSEVLIGECHHSFFAVAHVKASPSRPWLPGRLSFFLGLLRFADDIRAAAPRGTMTVSPEGAIGIHWLGLPKYLYESSGVANPLLNSRYWASRYFALIFERLLFSALKDWPIVMAAADDAEILKWTGRSEGRLERSRVRRTYTSYDDKVFHPIDLGAARRLERVTDRGPVIAWVGRLNWVKNWQLAITTFAIFLSRRPDSQLLVVGDGEDRPACERMIAELDLTSNVIMTGFAPPDRVSTLLNAANVLLLTSRSEGWPTAVVEALACGRPVVSTAVSGAREMIVEGANGFVIDRPSAEALSDGLERALAIAVPSDACRRSAEPYSLPRLRKVLQDSRAEYEMRLSSCGRP